MNLCRPLAEAHIKHYQGAMVGGGGGGGGHGRRHCRLGRRKKRAGLRWLGAGGWLTGDKRS